MASLLHDPILTFTGPAIHRQPEASGAAAVVGTGRVLALVTTQAPRIALALVDI